MLKKSLDYFKSLDYNITIRSESLDGERWYVAYCDEFGISALHGIGNTQNEALESFKIEKDAFIEFLYEKGEFIPEPQKTIDYTGSGTFSIRTTPWLHTMLINLSKESRVSLNSYINQLLSYGVGCSDIKNVVNEKFEEMQSKFLMQTNDILSKVNALSYSPGDLKISYNKEFQKKGEYKQAV